MSFASCGTRPVEIDPFCHNAVLPLEQGQNILSVQALSRQLKSCLETTYARVQVKGEISGFKQHSSGHGYFALKDSEAVLDAVCWKGQMATLACRPQDGMEVICTGRITTYMGRSKYQMIVTAMEHAGHGALLQLLESRKRALYEEGLFGETHKNPLPFLPRIIGVVTSPTGAVIQDILHRLTERFPCHVLLWPVAVQGRDAAAQISAAIRGFDALPPQSGLRPDVVIVARGGGSLEDLWCFNEEEVVRATAACTIPLISAVGHETDTTLIDYAADRRAPTPTAAAEMAVPVRQTLMHALQDFQWRHQAAGGRYLDQMFQRLAHLARGLPDLGALLQERAQRLDEWSERLDHAMRTHLQHRTMTMAQYQARLRSPGDLLAQKALMLTHQTQRLESQYTALLQQHEAGLNQRSALLESYAYTSTLKRGFALVKTPTGKPLTTARQLHPEDAVEIVFYDGIAHAQVVSVSSETNVTPCAQTTPQAPLATDDQEDLLH